MQINDLPTSYTFASDDVIAIEINDVTYKLTGATLASALKAIGYYLVSGDIVNNLTSTATNKPLSAAQGKALNDAKFDAANVYNGLDKTVAGFALDARQGKVLNDAIATKQGTLTFDAVPTDGSTNPVESNGIYDALALKLDKASISISGTGLVITTA